MDVAGMWRGCGLDVAVLTPIYRFHLEPIYPLNKGCESQCRRGNAHCTRIDIVLSIDERLSLEQGSFVDE